MFFHLVFSTVIFRGFFNEKTLGLLGFLGFFSIIINKYIFIPIINILILNLYLYNFFYINNLQSF